VADIVQRCEAAQAHVTALPDALFAAISQVEHGVNLMFLVQTPHPAQPATLTESAVLLDGVQDPGNVGTMLRTALALGASGVVALKGTAELTNPKVLRGSMGAAFRLPAVRSEVDPLIAWVRERGAELVVAAADGEPLGRPRRGGPPLALVVGNEGAGVGPALAAAASRRLAIPLVSPVESLNVAVAAGILLYEVTRDA